MFEAVKQEHDLPARIAVKF